MIRIVSGTSWKRLSPSSPAPMRRRHEGLGRIVRIGDPEEPRDIGPPALHEPFAAGDQGRAMRLPVHALLDAVLEELLGEQRLADHDELLEVRGAGPHHGDRHVGVDPGIGHRHARGHLEPHGIGIDEERAALREAQRVLEGQIRALGGELEALGGIPAEGEGARQTRARDEGLDPAPGCPPRKSSCSGYAPKIVALSVSGTRARNVVDVGDRGRDRPPGGARRSR